MKLSWKRDKPNEQDLFELLNRFFKEKIIIIKEDTMKIWFGNEPTIRLIPWNWIWNIYFCFNGSWKRSFFSNNLFSREFIWIKIWIFRAFFKILDENQLKINNRIEFDIWTNRMLSCSKNYFDDVYCEFK